ncbi:MAG TPA: efflux RND transporter periplasmic adaptor subunit [Verrucomicrobiae bacterium]|jgi:RND family efflux transporter MFP subunit|nr:efflux RND transporter periplasmic adaptor subunit [Verrucomicrobiae bacterium]
MNTLKNNKTSSLAEAPLPARSEGLAGNGANTSPPKLGRLMLLVVLVLLAALIAGLVPRLMHRSELAKETVELSTPTVQVISAAPGKATPGLILPAEVRPFVDAPIYARASGFLKRWYVDIGGRVEAGQSLADIDTPELEQQLSGAKAELAQAEAASSLAKITADRWAGLLKTASVSEQENAEKQADLKLKLAAVDTANANVRRFEDLQSFTHVTAPFNGTLTTRAVDVGDLISSGKELFRLSDTTKLRVFVRVPQTATPSIATGVDATLMVPELPSRKFAAKVVRTSGAIDSNSRTLLTELEVDNSKGEILSGSYAQVSFADVRQDPALVLPATTLLFRDGLQVALVGTDGKVEIRNIDVGRDFGKTVEVVSGITSADKIINNPSDSLTTGTTVRVAQAPLAQNNP